MPKSSDRHSSYEAASASASRNRSARLRLGGMSQWSEKPWLFRPRPGVEPRPEVLQRHPAGQLDELGVAEVAPQPGGQLLRHLGGRPVAVSAYSSTTRSRSSKRSLVRQPAHRADLLRVDALVHALVVPVVDAPRAADVHAGRLNGEPAQGRDRASSSPCCTEVSSAAHCDEDAGVVRRPLPWAPPSDRSAASCTSAAIRGMAPLGCSFNGTCAMPSPFLAVFRRLRFHLT